MTISSKQASLGLSGIMLAALLTVPVVEAHTEATATPVPFPQAPTGLPTENELQATLANRQQFMALVDNVTQGVFTATERYRQYVGSVKKMLAGCEVGSDISGFENTGFEGLVAAGGRQCRNWVADFDQQARAYAARLDKAVAFQKLVQRVGERVQGQIDRIRIALHAKQLKRAVDQGLREVYNTRRAIKPWMDSKGQNR
ncbi:MAG TPA: hypothetical protein ENI62_01340 [Gammaproteobacteria bacterium]|nr:hypothetical protein [Gammaproteobacteria bacterium]